MAEIATIMTVPWATIEAIGAVPVVTIASVAGGSDGGGITPPASGPAYILPTTGALIVGNGMTSGVWGTQGTVVTYDGFFKTVNLTDPTNPSITGQVAFPIAQFPDIAAKFGNIVCVARSNGGGYGGTTYATLVDISNPASPTLRGTCTLGASSSIISTRNGNLTHQGYWVVHDYASNRFKWVNVSNPDAPVVTYDQPTGVQEVNGGGGDCKIEGNYLYHNCGENKTFRIYNITNPAAISNVGTLSYGTTEVYGQLAKIGNYVYVSYGGQLRIIDVSNVAAPAFVGTPLATTDCELMTANGRLFGWSWDRTVRAFNISNPIAPTLEATSTIALAPNTTAFSPIYMLLFPSDWPTTSYLCGQAYTQANAYHGLYRLNFTLNS